MYLKINPVCSFFLKADLSICCPNYGSSDCPFSLDSDAPACPKTKLAAKGSSIDFSLPVGAGSFKPSCSSCAHLVVGKGTRLCGLEMHNDRHKEVEPTDTCERWLYDA